MAAVWFFAGSLHFEERKDAKAQPVAYKTRQELELFVRVENAPYAQNGLPVVQEEPMEYPGLYAPRREVVELPEESKVCYLTFDDGPSENTLKILEILRRYDAKATFFLVGANITQTTAPIVQEILAQGHAVGLHANTHSYAALYKSEDSFLSDCEALAVRLREEFGIETALYRFPGGSACTYLNGQGKNRIRQMHARGFACFDWNVSGEDSVGTPSVSSIQKNVFRDVFRYRRPVILLHDSAQAPATVEALADILERIAQEGYRFESLACAQEYIFLDNRE